MNPNFIKESIQNFVDAMSLAVKKSFLKEIFNDFIEIRENFNELFKKCNITKKNINHKKNEIFNLLMIAFTLLNKAYTEIKYFKFAFHQLFLVIEYFTSIEEIYNNGLIAGKKNIFEKNECLIKFNEKKYIKSKTKESDVHQFINTINFKVSALILYLYKTNDIDETNWNKVRNIRNSKTGHYSNEFVDQREILEILSFLKYLSDYKMID